MYRCMGRGGRKRRMERQAGGERRRGVSNDRDGNYVNVY